jgi:WD40 repeat protein
MVLRSHIHAHEGQVHCVKLYDDAFYAASWGQDSKIIIYDISHRTIQHTINTPHKRSILCGDISPDFQYMLSGGIDGHLFLWDLKTRENLCTMGTRPKDKTRKFRENHEKLLDTATPWDLGKEPWPGGKLHKDAVKCTAFVRETPTNRLISGGWDKKLLVWDLKSYASFTELEGHTSRITACDTAYDIRYCCTVSEDKTVRIWDLEAKVCAAVLEGHTSKIFSCNISSWEIYEPLLLSCGADGEFKMWDVRIRDPNLSSIKPQCRGDLIGHYDSCLACAICQDGSFGITLSHDGLVRVWRLRSLIKIILTVIVGEFGSGETSQFKLMVDPKDNVYSAKEQLRILLDTPISFTREGGPKFQVANPKFRSENLKIFSPLLS